MVYRHMLKPMGDSVYSILTVLHLATDSEDVRDALFCRLLCVPVFVVHQLKHGLLKHAFDIDHIIIKRKKNKEINANTIYSAVGNLAEREKRRSRR